MMDLIKYLVLVSLSCSFYARAEIVAPPIETRIKIAVIDTGIVLSEEIMPYLCNTKHMDFTGSNSIEDIHGHGTNITHIIVRDLNPKVFCIKVLRYSNGISFYTDKYLEALQNAVNDREVKYINISIGGDGFIPEERSMILSAVKAKKTVVVAAGNDNKQLQLGCNIFPACYFLINPYFRVIGNGENNFRPNPRSNYGMAVTNWTNGKHVCAGKIRGGEICLSGTSQSAALFTNEIIKKDLKKSKK